MLWTFFVILIIAYILGMVTLGAVQWWLHVLFLLAIGFVLVRLIQGRNPLK